MAIVCAFSFVVKRVPVAAGTETCLTQKITVMKKGLSTMLAILFAACAVSFAQSKGYEKSIEVNAGVALDKMSKFSFGVSMINGYRINEHFFIGALVGYEYFDALYMSSYQPEEDSYKSYDPKNLLKIGARVKANLSKGKISPFLMLLVSVLMVIFLVYKGKFSPLLVAVPALIPAGFFAVYSGWLYWYGHNLQEWGMFKVKPFMPTALGDGKVAQFTTHSYPTIGFYLLLIVAVLSILAILARIKENKEHNK